MVPETNRLYAAVEEVKTGDAADPASTAVLGARTFRIVTTSLDKEALIGGELPVAAVERKSSHDGGRYSTTKISYQILHLLS